MVILIYGTRVGVEEDIFAVDFFSGETNALKFTKTARFSFKIVIA